MHMHDMEKIEVIKNGKKVILTKARVRFVLDMKLETDYSGRFSGNRFLGKLKTFYEKYIFKKELEGKWEDKLYYHLFKLQAIIKEYMDLETKTNAYYDVW